MRVFYVVYPEDPAIRAWLNLLRVLANPHEKEPAHVTVRGPYRQRYRLPRQAQTVRGTSVHVPGADLVEHRHAAEVVAALEEAAHGGAQAGIVLDEQDAHATRVRPRPARQLTEIKPERHSAWHRTAHFQGLFRIGAYRR